MNKTQSVSLVMAFIALATQSHAEITYKTLVGGNEVLPYIHQIRVSMDTNYREFPYLFDATSNHLSDEEVMQHYLDSSRTVLVGGFEDDQLVAFIIGLPLKEYNPFACTGENYTLSAQEKFGPTAVNLDTCFYIGDMLVEPAYRSREVIEELYSRMETAVNKLDAAFCCLSCLIIERDAHHPLRPAVTKTDDFWADESAVARSFGFSRNEATVAFEWPTLQADGSTVTQDNPMEFWVKNLQTN